METNNELIYLIDLYTYKLKKCNKSKCKIKYFCNFYHSKIDKRRSLIWYKYYPIKCKKNNCKDIECKYSHNNFEIFYHPLFYKTHYCINYLNTKICRYGKYCCNAHSDKELRIEQLHHYKFNYDFFLFKFKTVFCPILTRHNKLNCIYAHNYQDFRRNNSMLLENIKCPNWPENEINDIYEEYCSFDCNKFHGWKEIDFNMKNYKTLICNFSYKKCKYKSLCPKIHLNNQNEKILHEKVKEIKSEKIFIIAKSNFQL